jgi:hypothetical protein
LALVAAAEAESQRAAAAAETTALTAALAAAHEQVWHRQTLTLVAALSSHTNTRAEHVVKGYSPWYVHFLSFKIN